MPRKLSEKLTPSPDQVLLVGASHQNLALIGDCLEELKTFNLELIVTTGVAQTLRQTNDRIKAILLDLSQATEVSQLEQLRSNAPALPIVVLVPNEEHALGVEAIRQGAQDYLTTAELNCNLLTRVLLDTLTRQGVEATLRQPEEKYRSIIDNAVEGIYQSTPAGQIILANRALAHMLGYDAPEELRARITDIGQQLYVEPAERAEFRHRLEQQDRVENFETQLFRQDQTIIQVALHSRAVRDAAGKLLYYEGFVEDITERKEAEAALRASEERYRLLFERSPHPMWVYDLETLAFLAVNDAAMRHYGYTRDEFLALTIKDIRLPEDVPRLVATLATNAKEASSTVAEVKHRKKDGTVIFAEITAHTVSFAGRPVRLVLANDITERKRAEEALRESEERYRKLFEHANDIIYTHDLSGNFTAINKAAERVVGYREEEALRLNLTQIIAPEYLMVARQLTERIAQGEATACELEVIAKDGQRVALEINTQPVYEQGRVAWVQGIARDLTERKQAEEALRQTEAQLRQAQKMESIGTLAGGVAHDFNNMLTGIIGFTDLALLALPANAPISNNLQQVRKLAERAAQLTRKLLAFARRQVLEQRPVNLNNVILDLSKFLRRVIGEQIEIEYRLFERLDTVRADIGQMDQVLMNLCVNARDAIPGAGKILLETSNATLDETYCQTHYWATPGKYVLLSITDTGVGMDKETQQQIFEPFFTTKDPGQGTGLGLSTVYGIIKQHEGYIDVYSEPGHGTTFKIYLPQVAVPAEPALPPVVEILTRGSETILVAEDELSVRTLMTNILSAQGYQILTAANGEEALEVFEANQAKIDLVISDAVMPKLSGRELYDALRLRKPDVRFLFISGYSVNALSEKFILDEGLTLLQKPFTLVELTKKVREVLNK